MSLCGTACRFWARRLAERGLVGVVLSQSPEYVAPHGSSQALFGTNPVAVRLATRISIAPNSTLT